MPLYSVLYNRRLALIQTTPSVVDAVSGYFMRTRDRSLWSHSLVPHLLAADPGVRWPTIHQVATGSRPIRYYDIERTQSILGV